MAILKCKMCGGNLEIQESTTVVECEYCGTKQTVPSADGEKKMTLFNRANRLRFACEFDKAAGVYESIVVDFPEEAEAYWGLVLCKYGIEYVDDPATGKKVHTCHRSSFESVMDDSNFEQTLENADPIARSVYRDEAKQIEELRKGVIEVSGKEAPYDIFICYKETAENGERTIDSVIAQDVYDELTAKGYHVFFSRITLEDKLGQEYEPYIFAALNSARVMLVFGTDYEYYNAVWVKNEWSRFLQLISKGEKKTLIPCYKNIDAYDMPKEFAKLQAQDMGKVGAIQDLLHGIEKLLPKQSAVVEGAVPAHSTVTASGTATVDSFLKRAFMFLEDGEWTSAKEYAEKVLDKEPECAEAYLYSFFVDLRIKSLEDVKKFVEIPTNKNYERAKLYAGNSLKTDLISIEKEITDRNNRNISLLAEPRKKATALRNLIIGKDAFRRIDGTVISKRFNGIKELNDRYIIYNNGDVALRRGKINEYFNIMRWHNIASISCCKEQYIGVRKDGTVTAISFKEYNDKDYGHTWVYDENGIHNLLNHEWYNIEKAIVNYGNIFGLKADGQVIFAGPVSYDVDTNKWLDIVDICCSEEYYIGLKKDGSVVVHPESTKGFKNWSNIDQIFNYRSSIYGLTKQGTIVDEMNKPYADWSNIVYVSSSADNIVALKLDGTVLVDTRLYGDHPSVKKVSSWSDIVAVASFKDATIGIRKDGSILSTEKNYSNFRLFDNADSITASSLQSLTSNDLDVKEELKKIQNIEIQLQTITTQIKKLEKELASLGLFALKQKNDIKTKIDSLRNQYNSFEYEKNLLTGKTVQNRILSIATDCHGFEELWYRWEYDLFSDVICPNYDWGSSYNLRFLMLLDQRIGVNYCAMNFTLYNENNVKVYEDVISFSDMNPDDTVLGFHWKPNLNFPNGEYYAVIKIDGVQEYVFNFTMIPPKKWWL